MAVTVRKFIVICSVVAVAVAVTAIVAVTASGDRSASTAGPTQWSAQDARAALHDTFPAAVDTASDDTDKRDGNVLAEARLTDSDGSQWVLAATDKETICASTEGTTTCQPADAVRTGGIFIASVDCAPTSVRVLGLVPAGVTSVSAQGPQTAQARATGRGVVRMTVAHSIDGLALSNGGANPLKLDLQSIC